MEEGVYFITQFFLYNYIYNNDNNDNDYHFNNNKNHDSYENNKNKIDDKNSLCNVNKENIEKNTKNYQDTGNNSKINKNEIFTVKKSETDVEEKDESFPFLSSPPSPPLDPTLFGSTNSTDRVYSTNSTDKDIYEDFHPPLSRHLFHLPLLLLILIMKMIAEKR